MAVEENGMEVGKEQQRAAEAVVESAAVVVGCRVICVLGKGSCVQHADEGAAARPDGVQAVEDKVQPPRYVWEPVSAGERVNV